MFDSRYSKFYNIFLYKLWIGTKKVSVAGNQIATGRYYDDFCRDTSPPTNLPSLNPIKLLLL